MAEKDYTGKDFMEEPDVFAEVFNTLVFQEEDCKITAPYDRLRDEPTEGIFVDHVGKISGMSKDVFKSYHDGKRKNYLLYVGIENETSISRVISIRVMGYTYAAVRKQLKQYRDRRDELNAGLKAARDAHDEPAEKEMLQRIEELGEFRMVPVIIIVLNYDPDYANVPLSIKSLADENNPYLKYMEDFKIRVFNVCRFDEEIRAKFKADFRLLLELLCTGGIPEELRSQTINHPTELFNMVAAYTKDGGVNKIRNMIINQTNREEVKNMETVFTRMFREFDASIEAERKKTAEAEARAKKDKEDLAIKMIQKRKPLDEIQDFTTLPLDIIKEISEKLDIPLVTG